MIVIYRSDFPEDFRRALADHYGEKGLATRKTIASWIDSLVSAAADDVMHDFAESQKREAEDEEDEDEEDEGHGEPEPPPATSTTP